MPIVVAPDGNEVLAVITPPSSTTGVSKRMTAAQIAGLAAHLPTTALATLSVFGNPSPNAAATGTSIPGIAGQVLVINDAGTAVVFGQVNLSNTASVTGSLNATAYLTGIVSVPLGGSGTSALTANAVLYGNGTAALSVTNTTANGVLVTNGSSVPSLALTLPAGVQANITQVNTLTTGTWNASIVGVTWGGSGTSSLAANSVLLGNGTAAISAVANATSGYVLSANGTSSAPTFQQFNLSNATGTLPFSNITSLAALSLLGNSSSAVRTVAAISGSASQVALVNDAGTGLAFGPVNLGTSAAVTGTLSAGFGGTGNTTLTANAVLLGNGTSAVAFATIGTSGRALLDQGAGANPSFKAISGDLALTSAGTATIANNAVTFAKFQTVTGLSLVGVTGTATANAAAITGTTDQVALVNHGGTGLVFGALNAAATAAITGSLYINLFNGGSSASTATFWRGDGTWVTPSGGGTVTSLSSGTGITLSPSTITGTGTISVTAGQIPGTATNNNATAGNFGEYTSSTVLVGSAVSMTNNTAVDVTTIILTAGDWDVWGAVQIQNSGAVTRMAGWISTTSATLPTAPNNGALFDLFGFAATGPNFQSPTGMMRLSLSATTTAYLSGYASFSTGSSVAFGFLAARRAR